MKKTTFLLSLILLACTLVLPVSAAESTVYVDGTGATPGAFTTLSEAAEAVADGGTIIVCGDVATPRDKGTTLPAKTLTITSQNGAKLTLGRVTYLSGPLTLRDITLVNAAPNAVDYIYTCGNDLTVESSVKTEPSEETSRNLSIFTGAGVDAFCEVVDQKINVYGGTWRLIYFGNWSGTYLGAKTTVSLATSVAATTSARIIPSFSRAEA